MKFEKHIIDEIFDLVNELSDINLQAEVWFGQRKDYESSYIELRCSLINDFAVDYVLEQLPADNGFTEELVQEMKLMMQLLKDYDPERKSDAHILKDPEWGKVVAQAQVVLKLYQEINFENKKY